MTRSDRAAEAVRDSVRDVAAFHFGSQAVEVTVDYDPPGQLPWVGRVLGSADGSTEETLVEVAGATATDALVWLAYCIGIERVPIHHMPQEAEA